MAQGLRLCAPNAEGTSSVPDWGTKILHAVWWSFKKKKQVVQYIGIEFISTAFRFPWLPFSSHALIPCKASPSASQPVRGSLGRPWGLDQPDCGSALCLSLPARSQHPYLSMSVPSFPGRLLDVLQAFDGESP